MAGSLLEEYINSLRRKADSTKRLKHNSLNQLGEFVESDLDEVTVEDVENWVVHLRDEKGLKNSTINQYLSEVRSFYEWLKMNIDPGVGEDELRENLKLRQEYDKIINIEALEKEFSPKEAIDKDVLLPLLARAKSRNYEHYKMILLYAYTGMRNSELRMLKGDNVDFDNRVIKVTRKTTKNQASVREIPYSPEMDEFLEPDGTYIIEGDKSDTPIAPTTPYKRIKVYETPDTGKLYPHRFRITFDTMMYDSDVPDFVIKRLMGHTTKKDMTEYYVGKTKKLEEDLRRAMEEEHYILPMLDRLESV